MTYTFSNELISDLHKDARGHRPSIDWMYTWSDCSSDQKQTIWDDLCDEMEASMAQDAYAEKKAAQEFEALIQETISFGAGDRETAIRWILQGMNLSEIDLMYGGSYICFELGLNYSQYENELTISTKTLLSMMEDA